MFVDKTDPVVAYDPATPATVISGAQIPKTLDINAFETRPTLNLDGAFKGLRRSKFWHGGLTGLLGMGGRRQAQCKKERRSELRPSSHHRREL